MYYPLIFRIQGVYATYFPFNSSKTLVIGPNTKQVPRVWVLITFYIIKTIAPGLTGALDSPVPVKHWLAWLPLSLQPRQTHCCLLSAHSLWQSVTSMTALFKMPSPDSGWSREQCLSMVNWDKLLENIHRFFLEHSPFWSQSKGHQSPQQVAWRKIWRSIQVLTTDFCCLALENARPSARYTSSLIKTILSRLFSSGKIWWPLMRFHVWWWATYTSQTCSACIDLAHFNLHSFRHSHQHRSYWQSLYF